MIIRRYLLNRVAELMEWKPAGWVLGLILTSLVFGFAHGYQGAPGIIENVLVGFLLGGLFLLSGRNLWLPILVHGLTDTIGFSLIFLGFPF
jgi:membrane protease YdiL (CAAX protease family)